MEAFNADILVAGDGLFYFGDADPDDTSKRQQAGVVDWTIAVKTGLKVAHIEIYAGNGMSEASRNGIGVDRYRLRTAGLVAVRRPVCSSFNWEAGEDWFTNVARGEGYDFRGLLCTDLVLFQFVKRGSMDKMYCSEFGLRRWRKSFFQPTNPDLDADRCPPSVLWEAGTLSTEWQKRGFEP